VDLLRTIDIEKVAFSETVPFSPDLSKADVVMALDCDFLSSTEGNTETIRQFSARRKVDGPESKMNRLYVVENRYTVTGGMADHRLRLPASQAGAFLMALAGHIGKGNANLTAALRDVQVPAVEGAGEWVREMAADLMAAR